MRVVVQGTSLPGRQCGPYDNVHVGLQVGRDPVDLVRGDAAQATWQTDVTVLVRDDGGLDFRGPAVQGRRGERFLYLTWGEVDAGGEFTMFRRAKLMLDALGPDSSTATTAVGAVSLTDAGGMPLCARVVPPTIRWDLTA